MRLDVQISSFENTEDLLKLKIIASDRIVWKRLTEIICKHAEGLDLICAETATERWWRHEAK